MDTVIIKSANRERVSKAVAAYARQLRQEHPEIEQIIWFGSRVTGIPTPGSDVDLCLVVSSTELSPRERIPKYLPAGFPVGIDLFVYTRAEFNLLGETSPGWRQAILSGVEIPA